MKKKLLSMFLAITIVFILTTNVTAPAAPCTWNDHEEQCVGTCPSGQECVLVQPEVCMCVSSPTPEPAPALSPMGLIALAGSLGLIAAVVISRR